VSLVLTFKKNKPLFEKIVLKLPSGEKITIEYLGTSSTSVRVGIDAPKEVKIYREKVDGRSNEAVYT
jgi:sRNA-binding carbon storage regulator CsrA